MKKRSGSIGPGLNISLLLLTRMKLLFYGMDFIVTAFVNWIAGLFWLEECGFIANQWDK